MWSLFSHLHKSTGLWGQFIFHRWNFYSFIKRSFCNKIFLVNLRNGLGSHHWLHLKFLLSFLAIKIEIFTLLLMIKVSFFLLFKCLPFFVYLSLSEYTGFDVNLSDWLEIDINSIITLFLLILLFKLLFFCLVHSFIELSNNFRVKLSFYFSSFWSENPIRHFW